MKCPYNERIICDYLDPTDKPDNVITHHCAECDHNPSNNNGVRETGAIPLIAGAPAVGCLFATIAIIIGFLFGMAELIKWIRG